jgi:hypothetical protein
MHNQLRNFNKNIVVTTIFNKMQCITTTFTISHAYNHNHYIILIYVFKMVKLVSDF